MYYNVLQSTTLYFSQSTTKQVQHNAQSIRSHPPTSLKTVPATKNHSHDWSSWHMKRPLHARSNKSHPPTSPNTVPAIISDSRFQRKISELLPPIYRRFQDNPGMQSSSHTRYFGDLTRRISETHFVWKNATVRAPAISLTLRLHINIAPATKNESLLFSTLLYSTVLYYSLPYYSPLYCSLPYYSLLYYSLLCYSLLYYSLLYYSLLYHSPLYYSLLYCSLLYYSSLPFSTLLFSTLLFSSLLFFSTILYSTILYSTILYSTLLFCTLPFSSLLYYSLSFFKLRNSEVSHLNFLRYWFYSCVALRLIKCV